MTKQTKEINVKIKLFQYDSLKEEAKEKAFEEHKRSLWEEGQEYENDDGEMEVDYSEPDKEIVEESIRINEYWFFENGEMATTITYTGEQKKSGITEFIFGGQVYKI